METIKQVLIRRDNMTPNEAEQLITEAKNQLAEYLSNDDQVSAYDICREFFGLEPDYIVDLL